MLDNMGRSALWHAHTAGAFDCVSILLNAGLEPSFGVPNGSSVADMITGSLTSREYYSPPEGTVIISDAKLRRQSDVALRRINAAASGVAQQQQTVVTPPQQAPIQPSPPQLKHSSAAGSTQLPPAPLSSNVTSSSQSGGVGASNGYHQRAADAFDRLPASVI
ncbi:unnamed protein product [Anisakis simplex]|uniref:ANK_REP_REGION domain-containing protein n=1 Tax=Anisakis simplex TaxID=6269 RepID=A0A0M3JD45_ANISI|nr:unnamed protein product [Anisakis simplex]